MRALLLALALGGCASSSVVLMQGEGSNPAGSVVVLDPKTGEDVRVIDAAGSRASLSGTKARVRRLDTAKAEKRFRGLFGTLPEAPARFVLYFPEGSTSFSPESLSTRDALFAEIKRRGDSVDVQIEGHTDRIGDEADNLRLSRERASAALALLVPLGLQDRITRVVGRGEVDPLPDHVTADNIEEPLNRRVEVIVR